jgi:FdrA protein
VSERIEVRRATYHDSVSLMLAGHDAERVEGVQEASAVAATPMNLELLAERDFALPDGLRPDDLIVAVRAASDEAAAAALEAIDRRLRGSSAETVGGAGDDARSLRAAARGDPDLSLAFVSVRGRNAAHEVAQALAAGMHVFCFSSGPTLEEEVALKRMAAERDLLLMGPDCGTAIIDGVALGFANQVRRGPVGIVGASGTGTQEIVCLLDAAGIGISHAIGVGGRDLSAEVGGLMTRRALQLLAEDPGTEIIVVVSKPPAPRVAGEVREEARRAGKPAVLAFLGLQGYPGAGEGDPPFVVGSLEAAAATAARGVGVEPAGSEDVSRAVTPGYLRGLFCGGSLCYEAMAVVSSRVGRVNSNIPLRPEWALEDARRSEGHAFIDFGDETLTERRPHPMIDPGLRNSRLEQEAADPHVGVVLLDVVLGHGAHEDPAGDLAPRIERAVRDRGGGLTVVVSLCGTDGDPQDVVRQERGLRAAGALVTRGTARAAALALAAAGAGDADG